MYLSKPLLIITILLLIIILLATMVALDEREKEYQALLEVHTELRTEYNRLVNRNELYQEQQEKLERQLNYVIEKIELIGGE